MILRQIGTIRSEYNERKSVPRLGGPGSVELLPEYSDGLHRLEKHSHLWVLVWLDQAKRDVLQVIPRGVSDGAPEGLHGVFAVRSPVRPNPIGLTLGRVLRAEGLRIDFDRLDFVDGTPVIDLKPYFLSRDNVFSARNSQIGRPPAREVLRKALLLQAINYHGRTDREVELAVDLFTDFRADILDMVEPTNLWVTAPLDRPVLVDALIGMTRVSLGRGTLRFGPPRTVRFEYDAETVEYELTASGFRRV